LIRRSLMAPYYAARLIRHQGLRAFIIIVLQRLVVQQQARPLDFRHASAAAAEDVIAAFSASHSVAQSRRPVSRSSGQKGKIVWIMSPPGATSGGHQNLFRFIKMAEEAGYENEVHFYSSSVDRINLSDIRKVMSSSSGFDSTSAILRVFSRDKGIPEDAVGVFATGWETAYPVQGLQTSATKLYFVQDYEPWFYAVGSEFILAQKTYDFGFRAITAGGWLAHKLKTEHGMWTSHFDFGVESSRYFVTGDAPRDEVFFYARPVTPRRGFELGILALVELQKLRPDVKINLAGWDASGWDLPLKYRNLGGLDIDLLNEVYNRCAVALVISATNMSLLPLELISSGVAPVVNLGPNNEMVSSNPFIEYAEANPVALAHAMLNVLDHPELTSRAQKMSESVRALTWERAGKQFVEALEMALDD
jgi:glycosyltransferase involved in cell wall biosynthesis